MRELSEHIHKVDEFMKDSKVIGELVDAFSKCGRFVGKKRLFKFIFKESASIIKEMDPLLVKVCKRFVATLRDDALKDIEVIRVKKILLKKLPTLKDEDSLRDADRKLYHTLQVLLEGMKLS